MNCHDGVTFQLLYILRYNVIKGQMYCCAIEQNDGMELIFSPCGYLMGTLNININNWQSWKQTSQMDEYSQTT